MRCFLYGLCDGIVSCNVCGELYDALWVYGGSGGPAEVVYVCGDSFRVCLSQFRSQLRRRLVEGDSAWCRIEFRDVLFQYG